MVRSLEVEGFVIIPRFLDAEMVGTLKAELESLDLTVHPKNPSLSIYREVHFSPCPAAISLIAEERMMRFLRRTLGADLVCMSSSYARYDPGYPGMPLHTDCQPYGSKLFGPLASVPVSVRVFYFLDDLTAERSPFRIVPYSHLCLHGDAHPYQRLRSHPEEEAIVCPSGSAILINPRVFHAAGANESETPRAVYTVSYRPSWAGPTQRVPAQKKRSLFRLPENVKRLLLPPNSRRADPDLPIRKNAGAPLGARRWNGETVDD
jgi:ectoine hydroxylase-related dioxygenase (phytanoyl-CoA dioxygenase family)